MESTRKFTILKASAGSGKTYTLVLHYLTYALRQNKPYYYKHILAITFTNAAANEMKQRVLKGLREITDGTAEHDFVQQLINKLEISKEELIQRAKATYSHMLHNYSNLSILTIDSFTHRLVRSFARDLQLSNDFNVELNAENLQEKAVDRMLEFIGHDELLTSYLHRYSKYLLEEGKAWNPREGLIEMAKVIFTEDVQEPLRKLAEIDLQKIQNEHAVLHEKIRQKEKRVKSLAGEIIALLAQAGVTPEDIPNKSVGYLNGLNKMMQADKLEAPAKRILTLFEDRIWLHKDCPSNIQTNFRAYVESANSLADALQAELSSESLKRMTLMLKIKDNLYTLGLIDRMNEYAAQIREEENTVLLSDFHRMINNIIQCNDAPYIFERIGARYNHILVDEFQDTSKMQWMNLIPLIQNCLAEGHENLIVGDAKQSIYRWRSANVEQFTMLPNVPEEFHMPLAGKTFHENLWEDPLLTNHRSCQSVIEFNNALFPDLAARLPGCADVYKEVVQFKKNERKGFVHLIGNHHLKSDDAGYDTFVKDSLIAAIRECESSKIPLGNITILVRSHSDGAKCAEFLKENRIDYTTAENALLIHSVSVRVIMGYFEFSLFPQNRFAAFDVIQSLASIDSRISLPAFIEHYLSKSERPVIDLNSFLSDIYGNLSNVMLGENVFHMAISLMRTLQLPNDSGAEHLLDLIKQHCISKNLDLHRFISWWKEHRNKLSSASPSRADSVNIMTIHKSKGLEFPVVIFPHFREGTKTSSLWIDVPADVCELPTAYVKVGITNQSNETDDENETDLAPEISRERSMRFLDEINNLYVATTRAEERLYFIQEKGGTQFNKSVDATLFSCFPEFAQNGLYEMGQREPLEKKEEKKNTSQISKHTAQLTGKEMLYPNLILISKLRNDTPEILYGKLLHECLSLLQHGAEAEGSGGLQVRKTARKTSSTSGSI